MKTFYVIDHKFNKANSTEIVKRRDFMSKLADKSELKKERLFVLEDPTLLTEVLTSNIVLKLQEQIKHNTNLIIIGEPVQSKNVILSSIFKKVVFSRQKYQITLDEMYDILNGEHPEDYVIQGHVDTANRFLTLTRGNLETLVVPFSTFTANGSGVKPNFNKFSIEDFGQTLKFGEYEAALDSVLYEFDSSYRKKIIKERAASDKTLGACLRRLRVQKNLLQSDFPSISDKEIRRIELGEIKSPHKTTLEKIANTLGVNVDEIYEY